MLSHVNTWVSVAISCSVIVPSSIAEMINGRWKLVVMYKIKINDEI